MERLDNPGEIDKSMSNSARKSLFRSPVHQQQQNKAAGNVDCISNDYFLLGLIQKQCLYIKAMEKELTFFRVMKKFQNNK